MTGFQVRNKILCLLFFPTSRSALRAPPWLRPHPPIWNPLLAYQPRQGIHQPYSPLPSSGNIATLRYIICLFFIQLHPVCSHAITQHADSWWHLGVLCKKAIHVRMWIQILAHTSAMMTASRLLWTTVKCKSCRAQLCLSACHYQICFSCSAGHGHINYVIVLTTKSALPWLATLTGLPLQTCIWVSSIYGSQIGFWKLEISDNRSCSTHQLPLV